MLRAAATATTGGQEAVCTECVVGTYSNSWAQTTCTSCQYDSYTSSVGSVACEQCPSPNMVTCSCADTCVCVPGYELIDGTCTHCAVGYFRSATMLHEQQCQKCTNHSTTDAPGSDECRCDDWYISNSTVDEHTEVHLDGTVHDQFFVSSADDSCVPCPSFECNQGYYQFGALECRTCPAHSVGPQGAFNINGCLCDKGYGGTDNCEACELGFYKGTEGMTPCLPCPGGGSTELRGSVQPGVCACGEGSLLQGGECKLCEEGHYKDWFGNGPQCRRCEGWLKTFKEGAVSASECVCGAGMELQGSDDCIECTSATYNTVPGGTCLACPDYASSESTSNVFCECQPGYFMHNAGTLSQTCVLCEVGSYKDFTGNTCTKCPDSTLSDVGADRVSLCVCGPGTHKAPGSTLAALTCVPCGLATTFQPAFTVAETCLECPDNSFGHTSNFTECRCKRGYIMDQSTTECELCPSDSFAGEGTEDSCQTCCNDGTSACNRQGTSDRQACECMPGSAPTPDGLTDKCQLCIEGNYKEQPGPVGCLVCGAGKYSSKGASSCTDCATGKVAASTQSATCDTCNKGYYATYQTRAEPCQKCPPNHWSVAG